MVILALPLGRRKIRASSPQRAEVAIVSNLAIAHYRDGPQTATATIHSLCPLAIPIVRPWRSTLSDRPMIEPPCGILLQIHDKSWGLRLDTRHASNCLNAAGARSGLSVAGTSRFFIGDVSTILLIGSVRKRTKTEPALCCLIQTGPLPFHRSGSAEGRRGTRNDGTDFSFHKTEFVLGPKFSRSGSLLRRERARCLTSP